MFEKELKELGVELNMQVIEPLIHTSYRAGYLEGAKLNKPKTDEVK